MEFYDVVRARRSRRGYRGDAVPDAALKRIAEAVRLAPTACNRQPVKLVVVRNPELRARICEIYPQKWLAEAPAVAVLLGDSTQAWTRLEGGSIIDVDAAIVMEHFILAATAEGLGTCWVCAFRRAELDRVLGVTGGWRTVALSPLGYSDADPRNNISKTTEEIFQVID